MRRLFVQIIDASSSSTSMLLSQWAGFATSAPTSIVEYQISDIQRWQER